MEISNNITEKKNKPRVLLVGGTHGNELTGVSLVNHFKKIAIHNNYDSFELNYLIANERAIKENKRYIDCDLNRSFKSVDLNDPKKSNHEQQLAKQINAQYSQDGSRPVDFIIDLHTSTSNMQTNIVLTRLDAFHLQLAHILQNSLPDVVITSEKELMVDHHFLESMAPRGIVIEVGPIAQGCLDYDCFEKTRLAVISCLDFLQKNSQSQGNAFSVKADSQEKLTVLSYHSKLFFPLDTDGNISAMIHPSLIGKPYPTIKNGDAIFKSLDGKDIYYQGEETVIGFNNEAGYYDQKIAFCLCRPKNVSLSDFPDTDAEFLGINNVSE